MKSIFSTKTNPSLQPASEPQTPHFTQAAPQVQAKMKTGAPDDAYEQEANSMAQQMFGNISMPAADAPGKPAAGQPPVEQQVQQSSGGTALPTAVRSEMEPAFGRDFGAVKVHTGPHAEAVTSQANAHALTYNNNIFYSKGQQPGINPLTAHELTHVAQQGAPAAQQTTQNGTQSKVTGSGSKGVTHSESPGTMRACANGTPFAPPTGRKTTALKGTYGDFSVEHGLDTAPMGGSDGEYGIKIEMTPNDKTSGHTIAFLQTVRRGVKPGSWATKATDPGMDDDRAKRATPEGWRVDRADAAGDKTPFYGQQKNAAGTIENKSNSKSGSYGGTNPMLTDAPAVVDPGALQFASTAMDMTSGATFGAVSWGLQYDSASKTYIEETPTLLDATSDRAKAAVEAQKKWNDATATPGSNIDKVPGV